MEDDETECNDVAAQEAGARCVELEIENRELRLQLAAAKGQVMKLMQPHPPHKSWEGVDRSVLLNELAFQAAVAREYQEMSDNRRDALLARGHTDECYSGNFEGCDCPLKVLAGPYVSPAKPKDSQG
ncbi:MAG TPA: hypothetical protein VM537_07810 [Anaerolineae bacterium]|nr:hypothetical protein [Anaerolineae bacterium]